VLAAVMFMMSWLNADASFISTRTAPDQGIGLASLPATAACPVFRVSSSELASASGLGNFLRTLSGSISTAVSVWLWSERSEYHYATLVDQLQDDASWRHWSDTLAQAGASDAGALAYTENVLARQAQTLAINDIGVISAS
jgi:DHA2 family multidrug resistance protein